MDATNGVVHSDDRPKLLPLLMRMLYGKFHSNETTHTASKDTKSNKRSTIIQFLSQCSEYELNYFFNLIFDCVNTAIARLVTTNTDEKTSTHDDPDRFEKNANELDPQARASLLGRLLERLCDNDEVDSVAYDLKQCVPFKKILGVLQSLEIVMRKLARQMESFAHRILRMLGFIHKYAAHLFEKISSMKKTTTNSIKDEDDSITHVDDYHLNLLKIIRQQVTQRFKQVQL